MPEPQVDQGFVMTLLYGMGAAIVGLGGFAGALVMKVLKQHDDRTEEAKNSAARDEKGIAAQEKVGDAVERLEAKFDASLERLLGKIETGHKQLEARIDEGLRSNARAIHEVKDRLPKAQDG